MPVKKIIDLEDKFQLKALKRKLLLENNLPLTRRLTCIDKHSVYLGYYLPSNKDEMVGFSEITKFGKNYPMDQDLFTEMYDLTSLNIPDKLAHFKSIYLDKEFRNVGLHFANLIFSTAVVLKKMGMTHCTILALSSNVAVVKLYMKMGGKILVTKKIKEYEDKLVLILVDVTKTNNHRFAKTRQLFESDNKSKTQSM